MEQLRYTRVTDAKSGEIVQEMQERFHSSEWFRVGAGYKLYGRGRPKIGKWDLSPLTDVECGFLFRCIGLMSKENQLPTIQRLAKVTGKSTRQIARILARLQFLRIVTKLDGSYYLNPAVAFAGVYLDPVLYHHFAADLAKIVPRWAKAAYDKELDSP